MENTFHNGEKAVQKLAGQEQMAQMVGRMIGNTIPFGADHFIEQQVTAFVASTDKKQQVWMSVLVGDLGFINVPSTTQVTFDKSKVRSTPNDIVYENMQENAELGLLFIDHSTRKRYRTNGKLSNDTPIIEVDIQEAYGNCPKYIQASDLSLPDQSKRIDSKELKGEKLRKEDIDWISKADTFYVATRALSGKTDASHRGGNPGFIEVIDNATLRIPDYPGNALFNTLGNLHENPNTGILFVDFEKGETLQLTGKAKLQFDQFDYKDLRTTGETGRFWLFETKQWIHTSNHHQVNWEFMDYSPFNPK